VGAIGGGWCTDSDVGHLADSLSGLAAGPLLWGKADTDAFMSTRP
jgi:hypothetical protein